MDELTKRLVEAITASLQELEENGSIVITEPVINSVSSSIAETVKSSYAGILSPEEVLGVCGLLFHAVEDKKFYDWEMPTLCGYKAEEMKATTLRLRNSVNI